MIIAITGANGYLGKNLSAYYEKLGHKVLKLVRNPFKEDEKKFILGEALILSIFSNIDLLIHTAFDFSLKDYNESYDINVNGTVILFEIASIKVKKLIYISSISSFENCTSNYGKIKFETEQALKLKNLNNLYIIRPGMIWGENSGGIILSLKKIAKLPIVPMVGANVTQYLIHYNDLAKSILFLIENNNNIKEPVTVVHPESYKFVNILKILGAKNIISIPWKLVYYFIITLEKMKFNLRTGSDNLVSLMNQNTNIKIDNKLFDWQFKNFNSK